MCTMNINQLYARKGQAYDYPQILNLFLWLINAKISDLKWRENYPREIKSTWKKDILDVFIRDNDIQ